MRSGTSIGAGLSVVAVGMAATLASCAPATVNKSSVRATDHAPESTQVDIVRIPYDPNFPYYVVVVEPLRPGVGAAYSPPPPTPGVERYGWGPWGWSLLPTGPQAQAYEGS